MLNGFKHVIPSSIKALSCTGNEQNITRSFLYKTILMSSRQCVPGLSRLDARLLFIMIVRSPNQQSVSKSGTNMIDILNISALVSDRLGAWRGGTASDC